MRNNILILCFLACSLVGWSQMSIGFGYAGTLPLGSFNREGYEFGNGHDFYILTNPKVVGNKNLRINIC